MDRKKIETQIAALPICAYAFFPVSDIPFKEEVRYICRTECPRYGKSWSCPPATGSLEECRKRCGAYAGGFLFTTMAEAGDLEDFEGITPDNAKTSGERLYALHGITGIRGEASKGYPTVFQVALPAFRGYKSQGLSPNDAGILTLLHIIAGFEDTNIIARSDYETMTQIRCQIQELLDSGLEHRDYISIIRKLDQEFIQKNISPGGSADILALTYFMDSLFMSHMPEALEQQPCSSTFSIN